MATFGEKVRLVRTFRGLTQKALGTAVGLNEKTADIRIAQYESGSRYPKQELIEKMADVLDISTQYLTCDYSSEAERLIMLLLEIEDSIPVSIRECKDEYGSKRYSLCFNSKTVNELLAEWYRQKCKIATGTIGDEEYMDWKLKIGKIFQKNH
ncbi:MAG: helix-turn-helix domain-containing protein [Ruminiclostridium sp.]